MSMEIIIRISDYETKRGFLSQIETGYPNRAAPTLATRIWLKGYPEDVVTEAEREEAKQLQEKVQLAIHDYFEPENSLNPQYCSKSNCLNAWFITDIKNTKKVLDGILKVHSMARPNFLGNWSTVLLKSTFSETLCNLEAKGHLTAEEGDHYYKKFEVTPYIEAVMSLGFEENYFKTEECKPQTDEPDALSAIFFSIDFPKAYRHPSSALDRYVSCTGDMIHRSIRKELNEKGEGHIGTYMTSDKKAAHMGARHVKLFLNAMLKEQWREDPPFPYNQTGTINKSSFESTLATLFKKKLLTSEELESYSKAFFNKLTA